MKNSILSFAFVLIFFGAVSAADNNTDNHTITIGIPTIALLDIEPAADKDLQMNVTQAIDDEAGKTLNFSINNASKWLNYTSVVTKNQTRRITAEITSGELPSGVSLKVNAATTTSGFGTRGTSAGVQTLSESPVDVITGIKSCYTEDGENKGSLLTYTVEMADAGWATLESDDYDVVVTYTITEN